MPTTYTHYSALSEGAMVLVSPISGKTEMKIGGFLTGSVTTGLGFSIKTYRNTAYFERIDEISKTAEDVYLLKCGNNSYLVNVLINAK